MYRAEPGHGKIFGGGDPEQKSKLPCAGRPGYTLGGRSISAIYSNIGKIQLPDVFETYVGLPVMIAAPSVLTKYGGKLKLSNAVVV